VELGGLPQTKLFLAQKNQYVVPYAQ